MRQPTITIAAPIRNREKILPFFLDEITKSNYPKEKIDLLFIVNDSMDASAEILANFKQKNKNNYHRITIETYNRNIPTDERISIIRSQHIYDHLSILRNYISSKAKTDYLLFCDSDILMPHDVINKLLKSNQDIVSGLIYNGYLVSPKTPYLYPNIMSKQENGLYKHISNYHVKNAATLKAPYLIPVDLTGAIILLSRQVYKTIKYGFHPQGEDAYFCNLAQERGYNIFCELSAFCQHIMSEELIDDYIENLKSI